ncbi:LysR family transcriptional regulator [Pusillimonas sp.]|uniref:LysR family transcriptional regulator n=1 Tax=Pusillimonas sp. TaxID=3040095 RepID=UPI0037C85E72
MELRQLRYFIAIADSGSFSAASQRLLIAQPSLSAQIKSLETELGVRLLERTARGTRPTPAGARFLQRARALMAESEDLARTTRSMAGEVFGTVRLGLTVSAAYPLAAPILGETVKAYPRISFVIVEALSSKLMDRVRHEELDLALSFSPAFTEGVRGETLATERFYLCTAPGHPLAADEPIGAESFLHLPLLLPPVNHELSQRLVSCGLRIGLKPIWSHVVESVNVISSLVEAGLGVSILPYSAVADGVKAGRIAARPISDPELARQMCLIYSSRRSLAAAELEVARIIRRIVADRIETGLSNWALPK